MRRYPPCQVTNQQHRVLLLVFPLHENCSFSQVFFSPPKPEIRFFGHDQGPWDSFAPPLPASQSIGFVQRHGFSGYPVSPLSQQRGGSPFFSFHPGSLHIYLRHFRFQLRLDTNIFEPTALQHSFWLSQQFFLFIYISSTTAQLLVYEMVLRYTIKK